MEKVQEGALPEKVKIMIARFPYRPECAELVDWLVKTVRQLKAHPRVDSIIPWRVQDTPITMCRNRAVEVAKQQGADFLLMLDDDVAPDLPGELPFFPRSLDFALSHDGPCIVAAPYCGPPPINNVFVFRWTNAMNDPPANGLRLEAYSREEAALWKGIGRVAALPTGLMLIDMRAFGHLSQPYFYYEYADKSESRKVTTEDVAFSRDAGLNGVGLYCNWDSWCGHWKGYLVPKPRPIYADEVRATFKEAVERGFTTKDCLQQIEMKDGRPVRTPGSNDRAFDAIKLLATATSQAKTAGPPVGMFPVPLSESQAAQLETLNRVRNKELHERLYAETQDELEQLAP